MNVLDMDASKLAEKIKLREWTSTEATQIFVDHLHKINPSINCLVEDRFPVARNEGYAADRAIATGQANGKLFGVPISMKEAFHVAGLKTTGGLSHRKDKIEDEDADVVAKLKAEGAIILGKTNTPTLCFCQESDNKLYGRTNNPWNLGKTAGGSSGGEAALIAAGGAAAGLGSDIGGSIRFPSHFNGVIGFKSGRGQVSQTGNFPYIENPYQERMLGIGPIVKSVKDAKLIYNIIAKTTAPENDLSEFKIGVLPRLVDVPLSDPIESLLSSIKESLGEHFQTEQIVPPFFNDSALLWQEIMSIDGAENVAKIAFGDRKIHSTREYLLEKTSGKAKLHHYLTWALIGARLFKPNKKRLKEIDETLQRGDDMLHNYLSDRILVFPVYHTSAPKHGELYSELFSIRKTYLQYMPYIAYANVWGLPSLTLPVGTDEEGLPIAVQLISRNGNEDALFQLGEILERLFRGYVRCKTHD